MRFFPATVGGDVTDAAVAAAQRAYQWGAVLPTTAGAGDLDGHGINDGMAFFRSSTTIAQNAEGMITFWTFSTVGQFGFRENLTANARYGARPTYRWRWAHSNTDNQAVFLGLSSTNLITTNVVADPAAAVIGLQQRNGDTNWQFIHKPTSGGTLVRVDTGIAIGVVIHDFEVVYDSVSSVTVTLRDSDGVTVFTSTITTGIPGSAELCTPTWAIDNISGTASASIFYMNGQLRGSIP
jgi:hypothetical protein